MATLEAARILAAGLLAGSGVFAAARDAGIVAAPRTYLASFTAGVTSAGLEAARVACGGCVSWVRLAGSALQFNAAGKYGVPEEAVFVVVVEASRLLGPTGREAVEAAAKRHRNRATAYAYAAARRLDPGEWRRVVEAAVYAAPEEYRRVFASLRGVDPLRYADAARRAVLYGFNGARILV